MIDFNDIRKESRQDPIISKVMLYVQTKWPKIEKESNLYSYFKRRDELSVEKDCLLWGYRLVVPEKNNLK